MVSCIQLTYLERVCRRFSIQRIQKLQQLCTVDGPEALLFIPGLDGRNNTGSNNAVKYIFTSASSLEVQRDDGILEPEFLDELIVLIQRHRVCLFYP